MLHQEPVAESSHRGAKFAPTNGFIVMYFYILYSMCFLHITIILFQSFFFVACMQRRLELVT